MASLLIYSTTSSELAYERLRDFPVFDVMTEENRIKDKREFEQQKLTITFVKSVRMPHAQNFPANSMIEIFYYSETNKSFKQQLELLLFNLDNARIFNLFGEERKIEEL